MSWVVSVADAGCMTIGVSVASEKQPHACSLDEDGCLAVRPLTARPPVTTLRRLVPLLGQRLRDKRSEGRGCALTATQHAFLSVTASPWPRPLGTTATTVKAGTALCVCFYLWCPRSHLNSPSCHHTHSRHSVSALLFDKTGGHR